MGGFAWVTLATNDSYSLGALVLAHSLKAVGTTHQLAVLVTPGVTSAMREKLSAVFNLVQEVNVLDSRDETNLRLLKRPELGITFTKLHCWRLTQFDKCVFLDADTLVLQYCDELFDREEFSAAPDVGWPDCFNSGVFVYRPSLETYDKLIQFALEKGSFDGGDQGLLNLYFSDWAHKDISRHLPFIYNMCSTACYSYLPAFKQFGANAKIIHFIGAQKPWLQYFNTETRQVQPSADSSHLQEVLQRWWDIFCSLIHPQLSPAMAGLAGAFAQLTLGVPRTPEQDAFENVLRKQAWEVGNIDYLGRDSFDNIWTKISETLSGALALEPVEPAAVEAEPTPEPIAPAQSQTESAPRQEEAKPVETPVTAIETPVSTPAVETSKDQPQAQPESLGTSTSQEVVESEKSEPAVTECPKVSEEAKKEVTPPQPLQEASPTPKETESVAEPVVCPIPEKKEVEVAETKTSEPQTEAPKEENKIPESQTDVPVTETTVQETKADIPGAETKVQETKADDSAAEAEACPLPPKKEEQPAEPEVLKETAAVESACPLPAKTQAPKETETQVIASEPKPEPSKAPSLQPDEPKEPSGDQEVAKVTPESQEGPKETPQVQEIATEPPAAIKEPEIVTGAPPQQPEASTPVAAPEKAGKPEVGASPTDAPKKTVKPKPKEAAPVAPESTAAPSESKPAKKVASSKDSPKTKVTEATPPATPGSPIVEKTKEALAAEASIPDTPPPTEGSSTPTPPPRKTDKPKKVAAKPKK